MPFAKRKAGSSKKKVGIQVDGSHAIALIHEIEDDDAVPDETLLDILHVKASCAAGASDSDKQCKGISSPSCLCGVIPAPDSFRRSGLWAKKSSANASSGLKESDPAVWKRDSLSIPVGLCNLGNTCYISSVLQCLFWIKEFRNSVFSASMLELQHNDVIQSLRNIFVKMHYGPVQRVDPADLISALRLDHSVQQDGQEFMKLFLSLLERAFENTPALKDVISSLFRGKSGYQTRCLTCNELSSGSYRFDDFSELEIPIKGFKSLSDSFKSLLTAEILEGDNQYFCDNCNAKRDASRQLLVKDLPPILCLSLQRFVFDMKKMDRVKATDKFTFPIELDASLIAGKQGGEGLMYDLEGILLHKGSGARHGHYVAHVSINDEDSSRHEWWRFDDTEVTRLEKGSSGHSDHGCRPKQSPSKRKKQASLAGNKSKRLEESVTNETGNRDFSDVEHDIEIDLDLPVSNEIEVIDLVNSGEKEDTDGNIEEAPKDVMSSNAYLLVYRKRGVSDLPGSYPDQAAVDWLHEKKKELDEAYKLECDNHARLIAETEQQVEKRKTEVRSLLESSIYYPEGDSGCFIVNSWLQAWADAEPKDRIQAIDNKPLLCDHGKLDPSRIQASKRLAKHVWEYLVQAHGGGPELQLKDLCYVCLKEQLDSIVAAEDMVVNREKFLEICNGIEVDDSKVSLESCGMHVNYSDGYFVGRHWLRGWKNRKGLSMGNTSPTASLLCPHGGLQPDIPDRPSRRVLIPAEFWQYLKRSWYAKAADKDRKDRFKKAEKAGKFPRGKKRSNSGGPEEKMEDFSIVEAENVVVAAGAQDISALPEAVAGSDLCEFKNNSQECPLCYENMIKEVSLQEELGGRKDGEKATFKHLLVFSPTVPISPGESYKLVPMRFMDNWRAYMLSSNKVTHGKTVSEPPLLIKPLQMMMCSGHDASNTTLKIAYGPPTVINRRGRWMAINDKDGAFELVTGSDWYGLWELYGSDDIPLGKQGITAILKMRHDTQPVPIKVKIDVPNLDSITSAEKEEEPEGDLPRESNTEQRVTVKIEAKEDGPPGMPSAESLITDPPVCNVCIQERSEAFKAALLNFEGKEIMVEICNDEVQAVTTTLPDPTQQQGSVKNANLIVAPYASTEVVSIKERKSKRARKGRVPIKVDSHTTIENLALRIYENLGIHPLNVRIFAKGIELNEKAKTLLDYEIYPSEELRVIDSQVYDADDLGSIFPDVVKPVESKEEGFTGTALVG
eukprot:jgi/Picsp_1/4380/NSC_01886-R1_ubiquitin carboxyl-terminal hydrolase 26-like